MTGSVQMMGVHEMRDTGVVQHMLFQIPCGINWSDFIWSAEIKTIDCVNQTNKTNKITWDENMDPKSTTCVVVYWIHGVYMNKLIDNIKLNSMSFCVTLYHIWFQSMSLLINKVTLSAQMMGVPDMRATGVVQLYLMSNNMRYISIRLYSRMWTSKW